ncbi:uncharacterized protein AMSG_05723 [Thecamonas trahens ATCC 50062]|uniref:BRCT domain-containing protein n=1 Tax=Thecamonas trahens ATCC 50062 TaxID=461836 RepID=A0A0L0DCK3_THETB|nr:hypothetical protein AMSG_05723 [Thecamonas trahens ATCC 50062]KNC49970.1 hypothetical protein AMSG_05723 [Thecamonas trahens ATCC 50062]|eukprot:XP_013757140.1 hypothetical protein AMSG_05723 [Thecamonas trahens ATCC 50062]
MARKDIVLTQTLELFHKLHALVTGADASPGSAEGARAVPNAEAAAPGSPATSSVTPKLMAVKEKPAVACVPSIADMGLTRMPASGSPASGATVGRKRKRTIDKPADETDDRQSPYSASSAAYEASPRMLVRQRRRKLGAGSAIGISAPPQAPHSLQSSMPVSARLVELIRSGQARVGDVIMYGSKRASLQANGHVLDAESGQSRRVREWSAAMAEANNGMSPRSLWSKCILRGQTLGKWLQRWQSQPVQSRRTLNLASVDDEPQTNGQVLDAEPQAEELVVVFSDFKSNESVENAKAIVEMLGGKVEKEVEPERTTHLVVGGEEGWTTQKMKHRLA